MRPNGYLFANCAGKKAIFLLLYHKKYKKSNKFCDKLTFFIIFDIIIMEKSIYAAAA